MATKKNRKAVDRNGAAANDTKQEAMVSKKGLAASPTVSVSTLQRVARRSPTF